MKVLFLGRVSYDGCLTGPEVVCRDLFQAFHRLEPDASFIQYYFDGRRFPLGAKLFGYDVRCTSDGACIERMGIVRMIARVMRTKPEILFIASRETHQFIFFLLKAVLSLRIVVLIHGNARFIKAEYPRPTPINARFRDALSDSVCTDHADALVVLSEEEKTLLASWYRVDGRRIAVIGNGVNGDVPVAQPDRRGKPVRVCFIGDDARPEKGADYFLHELALVRSACEVTIFGDPRVDGRRLPAHVRVTTHSFHARDAYLALLARQHVFVSASSYEPFGLAPLEAMARGVPAIVTRETGMARLIEHGVSGFIVPHGEPGAIARCVDTLASDPALHAAMSAAARAAAQSRPWDVVAREYQRVFRELKIEN